MFVMPDDVYVRGLILSVSISLLTTGKHSPCVHSSLCKKGRIIHETNCETNPESPTLLKVMGS